MTTENNSIVKQFLKYTYQSGVGGSDTYYSNRAAVEWLEYVVSEESLQRFCQELQLLLDMKECVYNHIKQMEDARHE